MRNTILKSFYDKEYFRRHKRKAGYRPKIKRFLKVILQYNPKTVLDIGCGHGFLVKALKDRGIRAQGIDFSEYAGELIPEYFIQADANKLPFVNNSFDIVVSTDFFEHLPEEQIDKVYSEMKRVSKYFIIAQIAFKKHPYSNQHLTVKPREWWEEKLPHCEIIKIPSEI